jgi:hypothetical protein
MKPLSFPSIDTSRQASYDAASPKQPHADENVVGGFRAFIEEWSRRKKDPEDWPRLETCA